MFQRARMAQPAGPIGPAAKAEKPAAPERPTVNEVWFQLATSAFGARREAGAPHDEPGTSSSRIGPGTYARWPILARLSVNAPNDPLERQADAMAEHALRKPASGGIAATSAASEPPSGPDGAPLPEGVRRDFEPRFGEDLSGVRLHTGHHAGQSARALQASAYTIDQHIAFAPGAYAPHSTEGRSLLAHEVSHAVQAKRGFATGHVQPRRVPPGTALNSAIPPATDTVGVMKARTGLSRVLSRAWAELPSGDQTTVKTNAAKFGITFTNEATLLTALNSASRDQLTKFAAEIHTVNPASDLGDPKDIDVGGRNPTEVANIAKVVANADAIFTTIAGGSKDTDIGEVFGAANVAKVKTNYADAAKQMKKLHTSNKIVTDRSGYNAEVGLGGLSGSTQISVESSVIDKPDDVESMITLIHESMHAGVSSIDDLGYIGIVSDAQFLSMPEASKLKNAAHYEVVPRRIKSAAHSFSGKTFVPAGTSIGAASAPARTDHEKALDAATETYRNAWTAGLNLHSDFVRVFKSPSEWATLDLSTEFGGVAAGLHWSDTLPFWSKVEVLTMHDRGAAINPTGTDAEKPVTLIDIALSEGLTRKLSIGMNAVPQNETASVALMAAKASAAEQAAATTVDLERDLLIRIVIRENTHSMTGAVSRDEKVVARMAAAGAINTAAEYHQKRSPGSFP